MKTTIISFQSTNLVIMSNSDSWLNKLETVLQKHLSDNKLEIKYLATELNLSERHFHRKIKKISGLTANQYLRDYRLEAAMKLLQSGDYLTVLEIGQTVGFINIYYFSKLFEKKYGETPMDILKRLGYR